jgi:hypothetical protein
MQVASPVKLRVSLYQQKQLATARKSNATAKKQNDRKLAAEHHALAKSRKSSRSHQ